MHDDEQQASVTSCAAEPVNAQVERAGESKPAPGLHATSEALTVVTGEDTDEAFRRWFGRVAPAPRMARLTTRVGQRVDSTGSARGMRLRSSPRGWRLALALLPVLCSR